jgi:hypothetical protein
VAAHVHVAMPRYLQGAFRLALAHAEQAMTLYDVQRHRPGYARHSSSLARKSRARSSSAPRRASRGSGSARASATPPVSC